MSVPTHIRSGPVASLPIDAQVDGYPFWDPATYTFYVYQGASSRAMASQAWVSSLYAPLASPTFAGPLVLKNASSLLGTTLTPDDDGGVTVSSDAFDWIFEIPRVTVNNVAGGDVALQLTASAGRTASLLFNVDGGSQSIDGDDVGSISINAAPISLNGAVKLSTVPSYASNAAAITAGKVAGDVYRNGDNLCIVH